MHLLSTMDIPIGTLRFDIFVRFIFQGAFHVRPRKDHVGDARHATIRILSRWQDGGIAGVALPGEGVHVRRHTEIRLAVR